MKSIISALLVVLLASGSLITYGQDFTDEQLKEILENSSEGEIVELNTMFIVNGNFKYSNWTADKLLTYDSESQNYNYRKGFALLNSTDDYTKPMPFLKKAITNVTKNYDMISPDEKSAPLDAFFHMGHAYHLNNDIENADKYYTKYLEQAKKKDPLIEVTQVRLEQCKVAKALINDPVDYDVKNVGGVVNSSSPDYSPVVSLDGSAIYYTSRRIRKDSSNVGIQEPGTNLYLEDIYVSYKDYADNWTEPRIMDFCKPENNEATVAVSIDERRIYAYMDATGNGDIYYSDFEASQFQDLKYLETDGVNTKSWEPHITVSPDGKHKFFSSDREGGMGGRDIYRIDLMDNGKWTKPVNVGAPINTPYDEDAPFVAINNTTMYFAHNGPNSMGGFDIFKTDMDEMGTWSKPENLGYPLNSASDEIYYTTTVDGFTGYLTSFRTGGFGEKDIYEIINTHLGVENVAVLKGEIESSSGDPIPEDVAFTVKCLNCDEPYEISLFPRISDGTFFASLYPCQEYEVTFHYGNGQNEISKEVFATACDKGYEEIYRHIVLDVPTMEVVNPQDLITSFEPLQMKHFFGYNKNQLDPEKGALKVFLDSLQKQIDRGRTYIELKLNSSASEVPTKTFSNNKELADKRANELKALLTEYFSEKGLIDSIDIDIREVKVSGPSYDKDYTNIEKYAPHQFASISLDGINSMSDEIVQFESEDAQIKEGVAVTSTATTMQDDQGDTFSSGQVIESDYKYHVITGVFRRIKYAEGMVQNLKDKGFEGTIIGKTNGMHMVSAGSANSFQGVQDILSKARTEVRQGAWIFNTKK
jgi:hypothetical protein